MSRALVLATCFLLAACSGDESAPEPAQPSGSDPAAAAAAPAAPARIEITHLVEGTGANPTASDVGFATLGDVRWSPSAGFVVVPLLRQPVRDRREWRADAACGVLRPTVMIKEWGSRPSTTF